MTVEGSSRQRVTGRQAECKLLAALLALPALVLIPPSPGVSFLLLHPGSAPVAARHAKRSAARFPRPCAGALPAPLSAVSGWPDPLPGV